VIYPNRQFRRNTEKASNHGKLRGV